MNTITDKIANVSKVVTNFNNLTLDYTRQEMKKKLEELGNEIGLDFELGNFTYEANRFRTTLKVKLKSALTEEQFNLGVHSPYALNDIIKVDSKLYKVVGWRKKARKRALVVETETGKVGHMMPRNPRTNELWDIVESGNKTNE